MKGSRVSVARPSGKSRLGNLARPSGKMWVALWVLLVVAAAGMGFATRASFTHYNDTPADLQELPYTYATVYSDLLHEAESPTRPDIVSNEELVSQTPVIVRATFNGNRSYCYQSFLCEVEVNEVFHDGKNDAWDISRDESGGGSQADGDGAQADDGRSSSVRAGDTLLVFEPIRVGTVKTSDGPYAQGERILQPSGGPHLLGAGPLQEGQEYLLFLTPKEYPSIAKRDGQTQEYVMVDNPYACLALSPEKTANADEKKGAEDSIDVPVLNPTANALSFQEAQSHSAFAADEESRDLFVRTRAAIIEQVANAS